MIANLVYIGVVFMGFLSIMNPIAGVSIFMSLTSHETPQEIRKTAFTSILTAFCVVVLFALAGNILLSFFGVSFTALRLAGGILVALIGYDMLQGKQSAYGGATNGTNEEPQKEEGSIAITPLGVPLLAGPGVIITAMNFSAGSYVNLISTIVAFGILCIITYFTYISGEKIKNMLGANILKVITKMMGLILIVIGTQMFIEGVYSAVHEFR